MDSIPQAQEFLISSWIFLHFASNKLDLKLQIFDFNFSNLSFHKKIQPQTN